MIARHLVERLGDAAATTAASPPRPIGAFGASSSANSTGSGQMNQMEFDNIMSQSVPYKRLTTEIENTKSEVRSAQK